MFILFLKKEQRAWPFAYIFWPICLLVGFIHCLREALLGWRRVCCFLLAGGPTFWSTVRLEHVGWNSSAWGGVGKSYYFTYLFTKTWRELIVCLNLEMVVKDCKNIKKTQELTLPIKCLQSHKNINRNDNSGQKMVLAIKTVQMKINCSSKQKIGYGQAELEEKTLWRNLRRDSMWGGHWRMVEPSRDGDSGIPGSGTTVRESVDGDEYVKRVWGTADVPSWNGTWIRHVSWSQIIDSFECQANEMGLLIGNGEPLKVFRAQK